MIFFNTVQFTIDSGVANDNRPKVQGGGLKETYILEQFHFHWGSSGSKDGSEHTIDGKTYPAEIHFVHFNSKYATIGESLSHDDGLAVVGFMFEVVSAGKDVSTNYSQIVNSIGKIEYSQNKTQQWINFGSLIEKAPKEGTGSFYRYQGSLTTPPCLEIVTWTLFDAPIKVLQSTLDKFTQAKEEMHEGHSVAMEDNFRPVQPLGQRKVTTNLVVSDSDATSEGGSKKGSENTANAANGSVLVLSTLLFISSKLM